MTKQVLSDLAILGGPVAFAEPLHVGRPNIGDRQRLHERIDGILDRRILSNSGPLSEEFEARVSAVTGARHAIAVTNATVGLEIATRAAGLAGEVIVPSFTFIATAHALLWRGLTPVFADVDPDTLNLDPASVAARITPRTSAILGVHLWGRLCDVDALRGIARDHGLALLFDASHAFGCADGDRRAGTLGDAEVFSFHATKFVNAFEGGVITTDDDALAERARLMRNFGFVEHGVTAMVGTNAKMHEASAAMALTSLEAMPAIVERNRQNAARYRSGLAGIEGLTFQAPDRVEGRSSQHVVIRLEVGRAALTADELARVLTAEGVLARRYFAPGSHRMEPYASMGPIAPLPVTERVCDEVLSLPTGTSVSREDVDAVCAIIRFVLERGRELRTRSPGVAGVTPAREPTFGALLGVKDEAELIGPCIANLRRIGVSTIVVIDAGSTDGTREVVAAEEAAGDIWQIALEDVEEEVWSKLALSLARSIGTDWVLLLDADEFWVPAGGSLRAVRDLEAPSVLTVDRYNAVPTDALRAIVRAGASGMEDVEVVARGIDRPQEYLPQHPDTPWILGQEQPKAMVRPREVARLLPGGHGADLPGGLRAPTVVLDDIIIVHLPFTTYERFQRKMANMRANVRMFPDWYASGLGWHWVRWLRLDDAGSTRTEFERQDLPAEMLTTLRAEGAVMRAGDLVRVPAADRSRDL